MKSAIVIAATLAALATLAGAASGSHRSAAAPALHSAAQMLRLPPAAPVGQTTQWGHIKSLTRKGGHFELRFDPAFLLHGATANQAAAQDGKQVANDYYIVDESHRLYTYAVRLDARATVLTKSLRSARVSAAELAQILAGKNPNHRQLFGDPRTSGFWIRVGDKYPNPALSIDQQYQP